MIYKPKISEYTVVLRDFLELWIMKKVNISFENDPAQHYYVIAVDLSVSCKVAAGITFAFAENCLDTINEI